MKIDLREVVNVLRSIERKLDPMQPFEQQIDIHGEMWTIMRGPCNAWQVFDPKGTRVAAFATPELMAAHFAMIFAEMQRMLKGEKPKAP